MPNYSDSDRYATALIPPNHVVVVEVKSNYAHLGREVKIHTRQWLVQGNSFAYVDSPSFGVHNCDSRNRKYTFPMGLTNYDCKFRLTLQGVQGLQLEHTGLRVLDGGKRVFDWIYEDAAGNVDRVWLYYWPARGRSSLRKKASKKASPKLPKKSRAK